MGKKVYFYDVEGVEKASIMERIRETINRLRTEYKKPRFLNKV